jgi:hypothetical protein
MSSGDTPTSEHAPTPAASLMSSTNALNTLSGSTPAIAPQTTTAAKFQYPNEMNRYSF